MTRAKRKTISGGSFGRRMRSAGAGDEEQPRRRWRVTLGVVGIFVLALFVRFYGVSHDLDMGNVYHPDTPKQISIAELYLRGHYYHSSTEYGRDVDGYPCFNMHLTEYEWRGLAGVQSVLSFVMGWRREFTHPHEYADLNRRLFVLTRVSVCVMSALAVLVVCWIGLEVWGPLVGLLGAGLAAVAVINVETAHYAMPDSAMDLFVCLAVLMAIRMVKSRRWVYPLLAGFVSALAFAAKYNGGVVLLFVLLLHVLKCGSWRRFWSAQAFRDLGLIAAGTLVGVVAAIPSLLIYPDRVLKEIVVFSRLASRFREMPIEVGDSRWAMFLYAARLNLSALWKIAGPLLVVGSVAGFVIAAFRNRRHVLPGLLVLLYLAVMLLPARYLKPYYFSVLTLFLCLYVAVVVDWLAGLKGRLRVPGIAVGAVVAAVMLVASVVRVARSDFFFWHMDTRRVATSWVNENIPQQFSVKESNYALCAAGRDEEPKIETLALAASSLGQSHVPDGSELLKRFELEAETALTWFRNPTVDVWLLPESEHLRPGFSMPIYQRVPSGTGNEYVFVEGAELLRSGRLVACGPKTQRRIFVIPERPDEVLVELCNGQTGNLVTVSFGGRQREVVLKPLEQTVLRFERPKRMAVIGRPFYKFWARAPFLCQAEVAVTDEQKGVLYYNAGMYEEALPHLVAAWRERPGPVAAQMAVIAAACSGRELDGLDGGGAIRETAQADLARVGASLVERFGISSLYVDSLPYIEREAEKWRKYSDHDPAASGDACVVPSPNAQGTWAVRMRKRFLEPGAYRVTLTARVDETVAPGSSFTVSLTDTTGQITYAAAEFDAEELVGPVYRDVERSLWLAERRGPTTVRIAADPDLPLRIDRIVLRPDVARAVAARDALVRAFLDDDLAGLEPEPVHIGPLLALGDAVSGTHAARALVAYEKAAQADPGSYRPYEAMRRIVGRLPEADRARVSAKLDEVRAAHRLVERQKAAVRFKNGAVLTGYRLSSTEYAPGDEVELTLFWNVPSAEARRFRGRWLFMHFIPVGAPRREVAFQADTAISPDFGFDERLDRIEPVYRHRIRIPDDVPPGEYELEIGILISMHNKRIRVLEADGPHTNNSATIGRIRVGPPREGATD